MQLTAAGLWPIQPLPKYIEDVFSTYLYTGNGSTQTITNGIDLSGQGGLVWTKSRSNAEIHGLFDTIRGVNNLLQSASPNQANTDYSNLLTNFNANGFTAGADTTLAAINSNGMTYTSWSLRKQPKFFDVVSWSGTGANTTISHSLGSVPACILVKRTNGYSDWQVYHRSLANTEYMVLNTTAAKATGATRWNSTTPTSTVFSLGTDATVNASDGTYVAYLFAHDAGGFGLTGTDNVISCGSFTDPSTGVDVNLGYEPQWVLVKPSSTTGNWLLLDTMRGWDQSGSDAYLNANTSGAEATTQWGTPTSTGFFFDGTAGSTYIYIAIRRGPMKVPTSGTSVFSLDASSAGGSGGLLGATTASDLVINSQRDPAYNSPFVFIDRLRGVGQVNTGATTKALYSSNTNAETTVDTTSSSSTAEGVNGAYLYSAAGKSSAIRTVQQGPGGSVAYNLIRAPGFFDEVCYTGDSSDPKTVAHNLGKAPELMIFKARDVAAGWRVWGGNMAITEYLALSEDSAVVTGPAFFGGTLPTATSFYVGAGLNTSGRTIVAYLFATCAGVSKVGSYTGTATTLQVDCGFTAGSRFVLIKRTDSTGGWYVWDSARGIVSGNDPYLLLNSTAAEVTNTDYVDTYNAGFEISSTAPAGINATGGTFIFLAIA
jgi:hypothetical protein